MQNYYKHGEWNIICFVCGKKCKSGDIRKRWDGALVCKEDYETRHILDFIKIRSDETSVPYSNTEPPDQFIFFCYIESRTGGADFYTADCMIAA